MLKCKHLEEAGLTYCHHAKRALGFALWSIFMSITCIAHGIFPWFFTETFSNSVLRLSYKLQDERRKQHEESEDWF